MTFAVRMTGRPYGTSTHILLENHFQHIKSIHHCCQILTQLIYYRLSFIGALMCLFGHCWTAVESDLISVLLRCGFKHCSFV